MSANSKSSSGEDAATYNGHRLPNYQTMIYAMRLSMREDKQISMDYWANSLDQTAVIGYREIVSPTPSADGKPVVTKERLLVRSEEEYTSPIAKIFKAPAPHDTEYIIMTENTIYIVDVNIPMRPVSM